MKADGAAGRGPRGSRARRGLRLEGETSRQLDHARGSIAAQERSHNAGGNADRADDAAELRTGDIVDRLIEVGMVNQVEELSPHPQFSLLPAGQRDLLHHREIGVEESRPAELVAALAAETEQSARRQKLDLCAGH
jgi:hypothetical protein